MTDPLGYQQHPTHTPPKKLLRFWLLTNMIFLEKIQAGLLATLKKNPEKKTLVLYNFAIFIQYLNEIGIYTEF